jgi:hypothetical protein
MSQICICTNAGLFFYVSEKKKALFFFQIPKDVARDFKISCSNLHRKKSQSETFLPSGKNQCRACHNILFGLGAKRNAKKETSNYVKSIQVESRSFRQILFVVLHNSLRQQSYLQTFFSFYHILCFSIGYSVMIMENSPGEVNDGSAVEECPPPPFYYENFSSFHLAPPVLSSTLETTAWSAAHQYNGTIRDQMTNQDVKSVLNEDYNKEMKR